MKTKFRRILAAAGSLLRGGERGRDAASIHEAAILHIDIVGSTRLVEKDLDLAHRQIRQLYARLCRVSESHNGIVRELRGDAAVVEFGAVEDAIRAALAIQAVNGLLNRSRIGKINPDVRSGISFGTIISEDRMITGLAVIRAQRIEQLAPPGAVLFDQPAFDRIRDREEFGICELGRSTVKGFAAAIRIYQVSVCPSEGLHGLAAQHALPRTRPDRGAGFAAALAFEY